MNGAASNWPDGIIGTTLGGRYQLTSLLGTGGMGAVFEGVHRGMGRRVAVKLLIPALREHPKAIMRFQIEAQAAAASNRRGVVDVLDYDIDPVHGHYLVMELLEGESLEQRIQRRRRLDTREALAIAVEILETLEAVHNQDIVHRDLKPANIFLARTEEGEELVKVLDFGISRVVTADYKTKLTTPGMAVGTPRYMAPEQAQCEPDVDRRADLYSVGAILYEALSGVRPYEDVFPGQILAEVILHSPRPFHEVAPDVDGALREVIEKAMARSRAERFGSAAEMAAILTRLMRWLANSPSLDDAPTVVSQPQFASESPEPAVGDPTEPEPRHSRSVREREVASWPSEPPLAQLAPAAYPERPSEQPAARSSSMPAPTPVPAAPAAATRRWWLLPLAGIFLLGVAGIVVAGLVFTGALTLGAAADEPSSAALPPAVPPMPPPPPVLTLEETLRAELESSRSEQSSGEVELALARLNRLVVQAHANNVQPETNEGAILSEAHLLTCKILTGRIVIPPAPQAETSLDELNQLLTTPLAQAVQHATQAGQYTAGLRQCAQVCRAQATERAGETYLEMNRSVAYRAVLRPEQLQTLAQSGTMHLTDARAHYEQALGLSGGSCSAEAEAGRLRVEARLAPSPEGERRK